MTVPNNEYWFPINTGAFVKFHAGGKILINQPEIGDDVAGVLPTGELLKWLHGRIQFYENLRVRDLFLLLVNYPEIIPIFPSFSNAVKAYKNLPKIGCCDQNVAFVGIKKEQVINLGELAEIPYTDSTLRLCIKYCSDENRDDNLLWNDDPRVWLDMKLTPLRTVIEIVELDNTVSLKRVDESFTIFSLLDAFNYSLENEIRDL